MKVADIGCGPGYFTVPLADAVGDEGKVYAIDSSARMLEHLRTNVNKGGVAKRVKALHTDGVDTGIREDFLDLVLFANVLHDIEDKRSFLDEVRRILKSEGRAIDLDWKNESSDFGPPLSVRLGEDQASRLLERNRLKVANTVEAGPHHYCLVCRKL